MSYYRSMSQKEEIETIKPRNYSLSLSDADVERIAYKAAEYHLTVSELIENFIGDLVGGTYSNGSDERMYAEQWAERCGFSYCTSSERNLISYLASELAENFKDLHEILEGIQDVKDEIGFIQKEIENPRTDWKDIVTGVPGTNSYENAYKCLEEYILSLQEELECSKDQLLFRENELADLKEHFNEYMGENKYSWEAEVQEAEEWYKENVLDKMTYLVNCNTASGGSGEEQDTDTANADSITGMQVQNGNFQRKKGR